MMPNPDKRIIAGLLNSYLKIRNKWWKLIDDEHPAQLRMPTDDKSLYKALTVVNCMNEAESCKTSEDWVKFLKKLYGTEEREMHEKQDQWFFQKLFTDVPLLGLTLRAVRAYILDQLQDTSYQTTLTTDKDQAKAFSENVNYHHEYFKEFIVKRDPCHLPEKTFEDFTKNVIQGERKYEGSILEMFFKKQTSPSDTTVIMQAKQEAARRLAEEELKRKAQEEAENVRLADIEAARKQSNDIKIKLIEEKKRKAAIAQKERRDAERLRSTATAAAASSSSSSAGARSSPANDKSVKFDPGIFGNGKQNDRQEGRDANNSQNRRTRNH